MWERQVYIWFLRLCEEWLDICISHCYYNQQVRTLRYIMWSYSELYCYLILQIGNNSKILHHPIVIRFISFKCMNMILCTLFWNPVASVVQYFYKYLCTFKDIVLDVFVIFCSFITTVLFRCVFDTIMCVCPH